MSANGRIEITIEENQVLFSTNLSIPELNFWLDHVKNLVITGQAKSVEETE